MSRLINADALMETMERGDWVHVTDYNIAIYAVKDAPTVDAVPVQRCKDRINQEIDELKENGEAHSDEVRQNGLLIAEGLRMALRIVEEIFWKDGEQHED